ncbi:CocE/NonD family hydrolase [Rothia halotolerans]|uniref:CocE/NonD family hydrolase n=1 Tax=Rothia halotolerans TaxID=405770 RepID=UPI002357F8EB|nr:CocE/NonD family hydrolase [Rothia halotolerans]
MEDWIPLSDGTRLWMKAWRPVTDEPVPAILEYLPYRHGDWTAPRDHERHPYYAGHGYASVRVDIRGHGSSDGVPGDEYDEQELRDGVEVIDWLAVQEWCSGKVGMFGISWGGFNSLQLAHLRPEALKAIVTVCSTDDRYDNDVHYMGGSMLGVDMHAWAATMLTFESRPPDIRVREDWKEQWRHRLDRMEPFVQTWMGHQTRDDYWRHGSVCEDYDRLDAAVLAVGGWYDPYRDTVLRLCENLSARGKNVKGLIGPWAHQYPDRDLRPGPHIDFLGETRRWFDYWLKDEDNDVMEEPLLRAWITDSVRPASVYEQMPGRWVAETEWPSPHVPGRRFGLEDAHVSPLAAADDGVVLVDSPMDTGKDAGRYFPYGNAADLPADQRDDDGRSVIFDFPLTEDLEILGNGELNLRVSTDSARGQVYARLCDVAPDGSSTMVTRGNLNLSARNGRDRADAFPAGGWEDVSFPMTGVGYRFPAGHVLRLALSNAYWPWIWPQPGTAPVSVDLAGSSFTLPQREAVAAGSERRRLDEALRFDPPVQPEGLDVRYPGAGTAGAQRPERLASHDVAAGTSVLEVDPAYGGTRVYPDGLHYDEDTVERYVIRRDDPLSARAEATWRVGLARPDQGWSTSLVTEQTITCDAENFYAESSVECRVDDEEFWSRTWHHTIPREAS